LLTRGSFTADLLRGARTSRQRQRCRSHHTHGFEKITAVQFFLSY
jgi:hypothetical protein